MEEDVVLDVADLNEEEKPIIKVIGVGGGGGNAANYMYSKGIKDVAFVICNTDKMALKISDIPQKIQLGKKGLGAGNNPEKGRTECEESLEEVKKMLADSTEMVFVTAGMGGGTGTGAAPLIARTAKEMGILTVGIVTIPFTFEGTARIEQALRGVEEMKKSVDSLVVISSERIKRLYSDLTLKNAFHKADDILAVAAKGIAEVITRPGYINCDLEDVRTVLTQSGTAVMGSAKAKGADRAITAVQDSLNSPLLLTTNLKGSSKILLNISYGRNDILMDEVSIITDFLQQQVDSSTQIIWGAYEDETLDDDELSVTIVAAGFPDTQSNEVIQNSAKEEKIVSRPAAGSVPSSPSGFRIVTNATPVNAQPVAEEKTAMNINYKGYYTDEELRNPNAHSSNAATIASNPTPAPSQLGGNLTSMVNMESDDDLSSFSYSNMKNEETSNLSVNGSMDLFDGKNDILHNNVD